MDVPEAQLTTLLAIADLGTFEAAARRLHLTPSAVSQRIRALESRVGKVVVERGTPCQPTVAGRTLLRLARQTALLRAEAARELSGEGRVTLPVAVNADSLSIWWRPVLETVAAWPAVSLRISIDDQAHSADLLRSGEVLAAVTSDGDPVQGCSASALGGMRYLAAATPALVAAHRHGGMLDWVGMPLVVFNEKDRLQHDLLRRHAGRTPTHEHRIPASADFLMAVRCGLGWGMIPQSQLDPLVRSGELEVLDRDPVEVPLYWQRWRLDSPLLDLLTATVAAAAAHALRPG